MKLWQLKKLSTGEFLNEPQKLPQNWGPVFGMQGFIEKLDNLSWLGEQFSDLGWFVVGEAEEAVEQNNNGPILSKEEIEWNRAKRILQETDWAVLPDVPMISSEKIEWLEYRKKIREIRLQPGFPNDIAWPTPPN